MPSPRRSRVRRFFTLWVGLCTTALLVHACGARTGLLPGELAPDAATDGTLPDARLDARILTCTPKSCTASGYNCGPNGNGCGDVVQCGTCPEPEICGVSALQPVRRRSGPRPGRRSALHAQDVRRPRPRAAGPRRTAAAASFSAASASTPTPVAARAFTASAATRCRARTCASSRWRATRGRPRPSQALSSRGRCPSTAAPTPSTTRSSTSPTPPWRRSRPAWQCSQCGGEVSGEPLVATQTGPDGTFTLGNVPVGHRHPPRHPARTLAPSDHHPQP